MARLTRDARRRDLLRAAERLLARSGGDALTLALVAEEAGVSKPIAYDHFASRAVLLCALYEQYETAHLARLDDLLEGAETVRATAETIAATYVDCVVDSGPVLAALDSAMGGSPHVEAMKKACDERYVARLLAALTASGSSISGIASMGFLGAARLISHHVSIGLMDRDEAVEYLSSLIDGSRFTMKRSEES